MMSAKFGHRGMSDSVQWAVLTPLVLLCLCGVIQAGIWLAGRSAVQQAAMAGAERATILGGTTADAHDAAYRVAQQAGLHAISIEVSDTGNRVNVMVHAELGSLLPGNLDHVSADARRPKEPS